MPQLLVFHKFANPPELNNAAPWVLEERMMLQLQGFQSCFLNDILPAGKSQIRLRRCIATINRWTDYCINREIIASDYWLSQKHRKIIGPDGLEK